MIQSGFFNSNNGDRRYDASFFAKFFGTLIGNGVFPNPSTGLQVYEKSNMTVTVKPGKGWINGYFIISDSEYNLTLDTADGVLNRIDRIVMRLDFATREIKIIVKKGAFASSPVAPTLQRDADAYELALADIYVGKGVTNITQANITDQRLNSTVCGVVRGLITEVDTTTIFNQYQAWFNEKTGETDIIIQNWLVANEQEFNIWFNGIKGILEGDVAANLASRITSLEQSFNVHQAEDATNSKKGHVQLVDDVNGNSTSLVPTQNAVRKKIEQTDYKVTKSSKDSEGIFRTVEYRRINDNTLAVRSVLSGGTSPTYTNRTITYYGLNGTTEEKKVVKTLRYDADGDLISEV